MSSVEPSTPVTRGLAVAIPKVSIRPRADLMLGTISVVPEGMPLAYSWESTASASATTWRRSATLDMSTISGRPRIAAARSSRPTVSSGLMRTPASTPAARQPA